MNGSIKSLPLHRSPRRRRGFSLVELMVVVMLIGILASMAVPSFRRALQQSHADIAGANLRSIWSAQRVYWLEYRTYTDQLSDLDTEGLIEPALLTASEPYSYAITSADATSFTATATRGGSALWSGTFTIDESGAITGTVVASGEANIVPGFQ